MTSRRDFVKSASVLSAGLFIKPSLLRHDKSMIGLQLYTVREAMAKDPAGTLAKVAQLGFNSLEGATYTGTQSFYGMDAAAFKKLLQQNGLVMPSAHYRLGEEQQDGQDVKGTVLHEWSKSVDDAAAVGIKYMVLAWLSPAERGGLDHYKHLAQHLNKAGEVCKKAGIQMCYHNHDFEFDQEGSQYFYDILLNETDKDLVKMELDLYWVARAGQNAVKLFNDHPGRFPLWHVKDMDKTPQKNFTEVGNGSIDFKNIFSHANKAGMQYFFIEQDQTPGDPFDSIAKSIAYVKKNLI